MFLFHAKLDEIVAALDNQVISRFLVFARRIASILVDDI